MFHVKHYFEDEDCVKKVRMTGKLRPVLPLLFLFISISTWPEESWIIPLDSPVYRRAEELFLSQWKVAPLEESPVFSGDLRRELEELEPEGEALEETVDLLSETGLPFSPISPILEAGLSAGFNSETDRKHYIASNAGSDGRFLDYRSLYEANEMPQLLKLGFIAQYAGFSLLFQPELGEAVSSKLKDYNITNIPPGITSIDNNFPFRGIAGYYGAPLEIRVGRDKLHVGPGSWSTLTLTKNMPYFDYIKVRFFVEWFSLSWYLIRLNATINSSESDYLDDLYGEDENPESNGLKNGKIYSERSKHYIVGKLLLTPFHWLSLSVAQTNLIGGRDPQLSDFNPLIILHNTYAEGVYSVPLSMSANIVPYRGIRLYLEYLFYDAAVGDERDPTDNPGAGAFQAGFTLLSTPFFKLWGGRFRLDGEFAYTDPWVYGKYYSLRQFTSRIIYIEHYGYRSWVDYPLGFYLGPDALDIHLRLLYGIPGDKEVELHWNRNGLGQIDMYGYGDENDYSHAGEIGYPLAGAPTGIVQWTDSLKLSFYWYPLDGLKLSAWYRLKLVSNRYNVSGDNQIYHYTGVSCVWKFF